MSIKGTDLNQVLDVKREMTDIKMVIKLLMERTEGIQSNIGELATAVAEQHQLEMENVDLVVEQAQKNLSDLAINLHKDVMTELANIRKNIRNYDCNGLSSLTSLTEFLQCIQLMILFMINMHIFLGKTMHRILFILHPIIQQIPYLGEILKMMYFTIAISLETLIYMSIINFYGSILAVIVTYLTGGKYDVRFLNKLGVFIFKKMGYIIGVLFKEIFYLLSNFKDVIMTVPNIMLEGFKEANASEPIDQAILYGKEFAKNQTSAALRTIGETVYNTTVGNVQDLGISNATSVAVEGVQYGAEYVYNASATGAAAIATGASNIASSAAAIAASVASYTNFLTSFGSFTNQEGESTSLGGKPPSKPLKNSNGIFEYIQGSKHHWYKGKSKRSVRKIHTQYPQYDYVIQSEKKLNDLKKIINKWNFSSKMFKNIDKEFATQEQPSNSQDKESAKQFLRIFRMEQDRLKKGLFHITDTLLMLSGAAIMTVGSYTTISVEQSKKINEELLRMNKSKLTNTVLNKKTSHIILLFDREFAEFQKGAHHNHSRKINRGHIRKTMRKGKAISI
jgi:hypothetical protein